VLAPAKINLFLEVLAKRPDGYHELETLMTAVDAFDWLSFEARDDQELRLECRWVMGRTAADVAQAKADAPPAAANPPARELLSGEIPCGPQNLVWPAAEMLRREAGIAKGAMIRLVKRVPAAAGLGGASSDAAATLLAANEGWGLQWPRQRLMDLAARLGSDVPFFLSRGAAVCRGRGEQMESEPAARLHAVIVRPPIGLSTPEVYKHCRPNDKSAGSSAIAAALAAGDPAEVGRMLANDLMPAAKQLTPWINRMRDHFQEQDVLGHQMSGSGSSYFGMCRSARHARRVAARLRARRVGVVLPVATMTSNE